MKICLQCAGVASDAAPTCARCGCADWRAEPAPTPSAPSLPVSHPIAAHDKRRAR